MNSEYKKRRGGTVRGEGSVAKSKDMLVMIIFAKPSIKSWKLTEELFFGVVTKK